MLYHGSPLPSCNIYVITVPYDLEQPGAYIESYHSTSLFDIYVGVCDLLHHIVMYISPIQAWIEEAYCHHIYIVARLPYYIFQTQYIFSARSLTYEMLR